jgi:hypothetical protein
MGNRYVDGSAAPRSPHAHCSDQVRGYFADTIGLPLAGDFDLLRFKLESLI